MNDCAAKKDSIMDTEMSRLQASVSSYVDVVEKLSVMITPIMLEDPNSQAHPTGAEVQETYPPLFSTIRDLRQTIDALNTKVTSIIDRICL